MELIVRYRKFLMGHRLSKIVTRTGDKGTTGLSGGARVDKTHPRIEAIGEVDELNSFIGLLLTHALPELIRETLVTVQHHLFDLGGELATPGSVVLQEEHRQRLEAVVEQLNAGLPPLKEFILPGGSPAAAVCHVARAVCRRAERRVVGLHREEAINPETLRYLNRLSDLLFVMARILAREQGGKEVYWERDRGE
jgi:cob(I)alamin adenosyltransferase